MSKALGFVKSIGGKISAALILMSITAPAALADFNAGEVDKIPLSSTLTFSGLITKIVDITLWVAGVLAVIYLIWGGITYITAGGEAEKAQKGRTAITNAIIGIIIIAAALAIYNFVIGDVLGGGGGSSF